MTTTFKRAAIAAAIGFALSPVAALAAPPAGSPYNTDPQNSHVFDQTSQAIQQVNTITCYVASMRPDLMVNQGDYIALVNQTHCDPNSSASASASSSGGADAASYQPVIVKSTRADNNSPMMGAVWIDQDHQGQPGTIFAALNASEAPSATNPYGTFTVNFCQLMQGACTEQGALSGSAAGLTFVDDNQQGGNNGDHTTTQLALTKGAGDSGAGAVVLTDLTNPGTVTYQFAYNANYFHRSDGSSPHCFDRSLANADISAWSYGLYDGNGNRVTRNSGFPIIFSSGGTTYQGYAGYWGVNLQPGAPALVTGSTVTKQNFDGTPGTAYSVVAAAGRLTKYTRQASTLAQFAKVHFSLSFFTTLSGGTTTALIAAGAPSNGGALVQGTQYDVYWDGSAFQVDAFTNCNGQCVTQTLTGNVPLAAADLNPQSLNPPPDLNAWSQSYGGPVSIPGTTIAAAFSMNPSGNVYYYSQNVVYPGAAGGPANLYCVLNCPTATAINGGVTPFDAGTSNQWGGGTNVVTYHLNGSGDLDDGSGSAVLTSGPLLNGMYQNGVNSGRMVDDAEGGAASLACPNNGMDYCESQAGALAYYYEWATGPNSWNQFIGLQSGGSYLQFDPPLSVSFAVPNSASYGPAAGSTVVLEYDSFGQLNGIPGQCVDPSTNSVVSCNAANARYVPAFAIPFDPVLGVVSDTNGNTYYAKWLDAEVRFSLAPGQCAALTLSTPALPSLSSLQNPSSPSDPTYIGPEPTLSPPPAPSVVDGVCTSPVCQ
jgi:hypothetical protein